MDTVIGSGMPHQRMRARARVDAAGRARLLRVRPANQRSRKLLSA